MSAITDNSTGAAWATTLEQDWINAQSPNIPDVLTVGNTPNAYKVVVAIEDRYTAADFYRTHESTQAINASDLKQIVITDTTGTKKGYVITAFFENGARKATLGEGEKYVGLFWGTGPT